MYLEKYDLHSGIFLPEWFQAAFSARISGFRLRHKFLPEGSCRNSEFVKRNISAKKSHES